MIIPGIWRDCISRQIRGPGKKSVMPNFRAHFICCFTLFRVSIFFGTSTNVGRYKGRTEQTSDLQTSEWYKRRTGTNVGLVQTLDWYKRRTGTNVGLVQTSDQYKRRPGTNVGLVQT